MRAILSEVVALAGICATKLNDFSESVDIEPLHEMTVAYWREIIAEQAQFELPNEELLNIIKASQVHCLLAARSEDEIRIAPWIASVDYGQFESEAHSVIRGMLFTGNTEFARRALDFFYPSLQPAGISDHGLHGDGNRLAPVDVGRILCPHSR